MSHRNSLPAFKWTLVILAAAIGCWLWNRQQSGHTKWVSALVFSQDGTRLASAAGDDTHAEVIQWDISDGSPLSRLEVRNGRPRWLKFAGESEHAVLGSSVEGETFDDFRPDRISVLNLSEDQELASFDEPDVFGGTIVLADDTRLIVNGRHSIEVRDLENRSRVSLFDDPDATIGRVAVSRNESWLAATVDGSVHVRDRNKSAFVAELTADEGSLGAVAVADSGRFVAAARYEYQFDTETFPLFFWDREQGTNPIKQVLFRHEIRSLHYFPGVQPVLLVVSGKDHVECQIALYDISGTLLHTLYEGNSAVSGLDITSDGSRLVWVNSQHDGEMWDISGPKPEQIWQQPLVAAHTVAFSPGGDLVAGCGYWRDVWLFDGSTGQLTSTLHGYQSSQTVMYLLTILPVFLATAILQYFWAVSAKNREDSMAAVARRLGWEHTSGSLPPDIADFDFFRKHHGGTFEHVLLGREAEYSILLAVYRWIQRTNNSSTPVQELCVIYPNAGSDLPDLFIRPEWLFDRLAEYAGFTDVDLDETETLRRFSKLYVLRTKAPEQMPEIISESLARFLCEHEGWNLEILDGSVLLRWQRVKSFTRSRFALSDADSIIAFVTESQEIIRRLCQHDADAQQ